MEGVVGIGMAISSTAWASACMPTRQRSGGARGGTFRSYGRRETACRQMPAVHPGKWSCSVPGLFRAAIFTSKLVVIVGQQRALAKADRAGETALDGTAGIDGMGLMAASTYQKAKDCRDHRKKYTGKCGSARWSATPGSCRA
jgi:hypothetical protein